MNPPLNIDWQKLRSLVGDLEITAHHSPSFNVQSRLEMTKLIYLIEKDLAEVKNKMELPLLNPNISSASVEKGFHKAKYINRRQTKFFESESLFESNESSKKYKIIFDEYFRQNDFQYWLLPFLLIRNNQIRSENLTLYKIIDQFIDRVKDQSFSPGDIEVTGSGATRCKTNLRFAFNDLKDLGLVYLYDKSQKNSWTLTFIGFFAAASFYFDPFEKDNNSLSRKITRFNQSAYYYEINMFILDRICKLSEPGYFERIVERLKMDSLELKELEKGPAIFCSYYEFFTRVYTNEKKADIRMSKLAAFLESLNKDYPLERYMNELSSKFDAEAFFCEVMDGLRGD